MLRNDKAEKFEYDRDLTEYLARFLDNKSVDEIIKAREKSEEIDGEGSFEKDAFIQQVDQLFGRGDEIQDYLDGNIEPQSNQEEVEDNEVDDIRVVRKEKKSRK